MNDLIRPLFSREIHLGGMLLVDGAEIARVIADIKFNPFDTQNMEVRLTDFQRANNNDDVIAQIDNSRTLQFVADTNGDLIELQLSKTSNRFFERLFSEMTIWTTVEEMKETKRYRLPKQSERCVLNEIKWEYEFPLIELTKYSNHTETRHQHRGLYRGSHYQDVDGKRNDIPEWKDDVISFSFAEHEVKLFDCFHFGDLEENNRSYPTSLLVRHSMMDVRLLGLNLTSEDTEKLISLEKGKNELVKVIFHLLSIFEHGMIKWYSERECRISNDDLLIQEIIKHKWIPEIRRTMWPSPALQYKNKLRELLPILIKQYYSLSLDSKKQFFQVTRCFELACYAPTLEVSFLYWHSCLDLLKKLLKHPQQTSRRKSFSVELVEVCENNDVDYIDLFPEPIRDEIKNKHKHFRFTEIRNRYIHDGFVIDNYDELVELQSKMCGLTERLILKLLGIDYKITPLGRGEYFRRHL